jgi:hypothetical protein
MSSQRPSFAKRDREMKLKDKAKAKAERRAARKAEPRNGPGGPPIAWEEQHVPGETPPDEAPAPPAPAPAAAPSSGRPR